MQPSSRIVYLVELACNEFGVIGVRALIGSALQFTTDEELRKALVAALDHMMSPEFKFGARADKEINDKQAKLRNARRGVEAFLQEAERLALRQVIRKGVTDTVVAIIQQMRPSLASEEAHAIACILAEERR